MGGADEARDDMVGVANGVGGDEGGGANATVLQAPTTQGATVMS